MSFAPLAFKLFCAARGLSNAATNRIDETKDFYIAINDTNDATYQTDTNTDEWSAGMNFTYHSMDVVNGETHEDDVVNSIKSLYFQNYTDDSGVMVSKNVVQSTDVGTWTASLSTTHTLSGWDFSASQHIDGNRDAPGTSGYVSFRKEHYSNQSILRPRRSSAPSRARTPRRTSSRGTTPGSV